MKTKSAPYLLVFALAATVAWADDPAPSGAPAGPAAPMASAANPVTTKPELRGVLATASEQKFNLSVPGSGHSEWLSVGETFGDWKLAEYRAADSALVLRKSDGTEVDLSLASSQVKPEEIKATLADAQDVLTKMNFVKTIRLVLEQQTKAMSEMSKKIAASKGLTGDPKAFDEYQKKAQEIIQSALDPQEMADATAQIYSEVFSKDELAGLGDFFASPVGQAYTDKTPLVSQKLQAIMMPKMMSIGTQLQALSKQQAAAQTAAATPANGALPSAPVAPAPTPAPQG